MSWYSDRKEEWKKTIETVSRELEKQKPFVEKDVIQSMFLKELSKSDLPFVFKGGTSLSKSYRLIDRFSEDIDLSMARKLTASEKKRSKAEIIKAADAVGLTLVNPGEVMSGHDYNIYDFSYDSLFLLEANILVETNYYQPSPETEKRTIKSYVGDYYEGNEKAFPIPFPATDFEMTVLNLRRTFVDKIFALCNFRIANMKERDSRHLYDIYKIIGNIDFDRELYGLVDRLRNDVSFYRRNPSARPECDIPGLLREIVSSRFYEPDYNGITAPLLYEEVDYDTAVEGGIAKVAESDLFKYRP